MSKSKEKKQKEKKRQESTEKKKKEKHSHHKKEKNAMKKRFMEKVEPDLSTKDDEVDPNNQEFMDKTSKNEV